MIESRRDYWRKELFWRITIVLGGLLAESVLVLYTYNFFKMMINRVW